VTAGYGIDEIDFCDCDAGVLYRLDCVAYLNGLAQKRAGEAFSRAGIPKRFEAMTLESYAPLATDDNKRSALEIARRWSAGETAKPGVLFSGPFGTGKTGLATACLSRALENGTGAGLWIEWYDFVDSIQGRYGKGDGSAQERIEQAQRIPLLLLDDVGDKRKREESADKQRLLYQIINHRMNYELPVLITTNLTPQEMALQYGDRTMERIAYLCELVYVGGRNLRK